ncbi:MAG: hypothetical protein WCT77_02240 [Bacteroidota bacterium]
MSSPEYNVFSLDVEQPLRLLEKRGFDYSKINVLPLYHCTTSGGEPVSVVPLLIDDSNEKDNNLKIVLFLLDSRQNLVAYKQTHVSGQGITNNAEGYIYSAQRAKGYSTVLELTNADMLQRAAHQCGPIVQRIQNLNASSGRKEEQDRWLSNYGPTGKFGFDNEMKKVFSPSNISFDDLQMAAKVNLEYKHEIIGGRDIISPLATIFHSETSITDLHQQRQNFFEHKVLPQLKRNSKPNKSIK